MFHGAELKKLISEFLEVHCPNRLHQSPRTVGNKRDTFRKFLKWLGDKEFNKDNLQEFVDFLDTYMQPQSRNTQLRYIKSFIRFLIDQKELEINWASKVKYAKETQKKIELVSPLVMEKIIIEGCRPGPTDNSYNARQKKEMELAMRFDLRTGLRRKELLGMRGSDLELDNNPPIFYVKGKGGNIEPAVLPKDMVSALRDRITRDRVFRTAGSGCNRAIKRGMKKLGIVGKNLTLHSIRHIFATALLQKGVSLQVVSRLLRHSSVDITDKIYTHYNLQDLAVVINTKQELVRLSASVDEVFDDIVYAMNNTGIDNDPRFKKTIERDGKSLIFKIVVA